MKLSAKWSTVSFFTVMAMGAGAFAYAGCTVTSGEIDDEDGGTGTPRPDSGTTGGDSGGSDAGAGDAGPIGTGCTPLNQKQQLISNECQTCLEQNCCAELQGCYNLTIPDGEPTCDTYADEVAKNQCDTDPAADAGSDACNAVRSAVDPAIPGAYHAIATCAGSAACKTACGL